jgi:hypothetical protein
MHKAPMPPGLSLAPMVLPDRPPIVVPKTAPYHGPIPALIDLGSSAARLRSVSWRVPPISSLYLAVGLVSLIVLRGTEIAVFEDLPVEPIRLASGTDRRGAVGLLQLLGPAPVVPRLVEEPCEGRPTRPAGGSLPGACASSLRSQCMRTKWLPSSERSRLVGLAS